VKLGNANLLVALIFTIIGWFNTAYGLSINIQGDELHSEEPGGVLNCVDIGGEYGGFQIVSTEVGKKPRLCLSSTRINAIRFHDVTLVASSTSPTEGTLTFEHEFATGPISLVYARTVLKGFFSTAKGVGVPTGNQVSFSGVFSQGGSETTIGEPLEQTVGEDLESSILNSVAREQYVISGKRKLKGVLIFSLNNQGDKLVLEQDSAVIIDNVERQGE
jgi:hypothetical protein